MAVSGRESWSPRRSSGRSRLEIERLKSEHGIVPGLVVIMAGDDPASRSYVNSKSKLAEKLGIHSELVKLPEKRGGR